jgi:hypothetical protein
LLKSAEFFFFFFFFFSPIFKSATHRHPVQLKTRMTFVARTRAFVPLAEFHCIVIAALVATAHASSSASGEADQGNVMLLACGVASVVFAVVVWWYD